MLKLYRHTYLNSVFFYAWFGVIMLFIVSFFIDRLYNPTWLLFYTLLFLTGVDWVILFINKKAILAKRLTPEKLSNGDQNKIEIEIQNLYNFTTNLTIIDEIPFQFQVRDFEIKAKYDSGENRKVEYHLRPTERGEYNFGNVNIYALSPLQLISRKYIFDGNYTIPTYPSYVQLRKFDLIAFSNKLFQQGLKKIRRIGHVMEFEQIREYVQGNDIRTINWKATAKRNTLMVNQFQDEKSQSVYMLIDKGRAMKMPFNELTLLDYAINATLVLSHIILKKNDKAGMLTFSKKVENRIIADRKQKQMHLFLENLYQIKSNFQETDFSKLLVDVKNNITHRSLLLLFTNFETLDGLHRQLPYLKSLAKNHLLVVVFFKNTELEALKNKKANNVQEIYDKVIAEKFDFEKRLIVNELRKYGIQCLLTKPEDLTIDAINKYLEIKSRGIL